MSVMYCTLPPSSNVGASCAHPVDERGCPKSTRSLLERLHPLQQRSRSGLVERLVEVAAFRARDAGGTPRLAGAPGEHRHRVRPPACEAVESSLRQADAAGMAVVDEDRRCSGLKVE